MEHLGSFSSSGNYEAYFCDKILNKDQGFSGKWFKSFHIYSFESHFVWRSGTISTILVEGFRRNIIWN